MEHKTLSITVYRVSQQITKEHTKLLDTTSIHLLLPYYDNIMVKDYWTYLTRWNLATSDRVGAITKTRRCACSTDTYVSEAVDTNYVSAENRKWFLGAVPGESHVVFLANSKIV